MTNDPVRAWQRWKTGSPPPTAFRVFGLRSRRGRLRSHSFRPRGILRTEKGFDASDELAERLWRVVRRCLRQEQHLLALERLGSRPVLDPQFLQPPERYAAGGDRDQRAGHGYREPDRAGDVGVRRQHRYARREGDFRQPEALEPALIPRSSGRTASGSGRPPARSDTVPVPWRRQSERWAAGSWGGVESLAIAPYLRNNGLRNFRCNPSTSHPAAASPAPSRIWCSVLR